MGTSFPLGPRVSSRRGSQIGGVPGRVQSSPAPATARGPCRRVFRPGRSIDWLEAGRRPVAGQVEVEEQRVAVGGQQDVRGLTSPWATSRLKAWSRASASRAPPTRPPGCRRGPPASHGPAAPRERSDTRARRRSRGRRAGRAPSRGRLARSPPRRQHGGQGRAPQNGMQINWNASSSTRRATRSRRCGHAAPGPAATARGSSVSRP